MGDDRQIVRFFLRGDGPLVSILIATRGRPEGLFKSVESLFNTAKNKTCFEIIFKIDEDDEPTLKMVESMEKIPALSIKKIISPRGRGYPDFHHWINYLSFIARGDWLFLFNDDALMTTMGWDEELEYLFPRQTWCGMNEICYLVSTKSNDFPFIRRGTVDVLGYLSLDFVGIDEVMKVLGTALTVNINFDHVPSPNSPEKQAAWNAGFARGNEGRRFRVNAAVYLLDYIERLSVPTRGPSQPGWYKIDMASGPSFSACFLEEGKTLVWMSTEPKLLLHFPPDAQWYFLHGFHPPRCDGSLVLDSL